MRRRGKRWATLVDRHHHALFHAMQRLFEDRLESPVSTPIGHAWWDEGYWRFGQGYGDDRLAQQFLNMAGWEPLLPEVPDYGVWKSVDNHHPNRPIYGIELDAVRNTPEEWAYVVATVQDNQAGFKRLADEIGAKYVLQVGNTNQDVDWSLDPLALVSSEVPIRGKGIVIHQEMDPIFDWRQPVSSSRVIRSFVNCFGSTPCEALFREVHALLPEFNFRSHGIDGPDGNVETVKGIADLMSMSLFGWHDKHQGDGFGHVIHDWAAIGRPLIGHGNHYTGLMGEVFWQDGVTCIDLDKHTTQEAAQLIRDIAADPQRHLEMCRAMRAVFEANVDFAAEGERVREFLGLKILFIGDAAATGFGTVTSDLGRALLELGEDVRFLSQNAAGFAIPEPLGSRTYRLRDDARPESVLAALKGGMPDGWAPEAIIVLGDYFAARWIVVDPRVKEALASVPSFHYCPVEGEGLPPAWKGLWDIVKPVAMTDFGATEIAKVMGYRPPMIYHGVDQSVFYPIAPNRPSAHKNDDGSHSTTKASAKRQFGIDPNRVILLRTDRHMPRKQYNHMLRALEPVFERNPEVDMVIHCRVHDQGGFLMDTLSKFSIPFRQRILLTLAHDSWQGLSREELNLLYNAADIYVQNSAEGFGLTIAEAIACGVPAVGIDYSAVPEVIGPAGLTAKVSHLIDNEYDHHWASVDPLDWGAKVERLIRKPSLRRSLGSNGPKHVAKNFSWTRAGEQFRDLIHASASEVAA